MALIEAKRISKDYRLGNTVVHALANVDITIDPGEFVAVCGPSGSGKTTLLNLIGVLDEPDGGELLFNGQEVGQLSDNAKTALRNTHIGFVFQGFNLIPVLTALENVMLPLRINNVPRRIARKTATSRLAEVGLSRFEAHRPDTLSGGQQQRVAIARALITNPLLVIADEPTANLDSATAQSILSLMRNLNEKEKTTFLFSTHDQRLLDHVHRNIHLEDGRTGGMNNG